MKRDLQICKETYVYGKETYVYRKETYMYRFLSRVRSAAKRKCEQ